MNPPFRPAELIRSLQTANVQFVTVGGFAAQLHGATRSTQDLDVVPAWTEANLARLCAWLRSVNATPRSGSAITPDEITPDLLREREMINWTTDLGHIDTLVAIPDKNGQPVDFVGLLPRSKAFPFDSDRLLVAGLDDIIVSKERAGRRKDAAALPELLRIQRAATERKEPPGQNPGCPGPEF